MVQHCRVTFLCEQILHTPFLHPQKMNTKKISHSISDALFIASWIKYKLNWNEIKISLYHKSTGCLRYSQSHFSPQLLPKCANSLSLWENHEKFVKLLSPHEAFVNDELNNYTSVVGKLYWEEMCFNGLTQNRVCSWYQNCITNNKGYDEFHRKSFYFLNSRGMRYNPIFYFFVHWQILDKHNILRMWNF